MLNAIHKNSILQILISLTRVMRYKLHKGLLMQIILYFICFRHLAHLYFNHK